MSSRESSADATSYYPSWTAADNNVSVSFQGKELGVIRRGDLHFDIRVTAFVPPKSHGEPDSEEYKVDLTLESTADGETSEERHCPAELWGLTGSDDEEEEALLDSSKLNPRWVEAFARQALDTPAIRAGIIELTGAEFEITDETEWEIEGLRLNESELPRGGKQAMWLEVSAYTPPKALPDQGESAVPAIMLEQFD